jgi:hypothetical protein
MAFYVTIALISGCASSHITVAWKNWYPSANYDKIMVTGIVKSPNDLLRRQIEKDLARDLQELGYNAFSMIDEFGAAGLGSDTQEETYVKLCDKGVDAVVILSLIDRSKEKIHQRRRSFGYPDNYYYDRILSYRNIQADLKDDGREKKGYFWEAILFNLRTLKAECTIQTRRFRNMSQEKIAKDIDKRIIKRMLKENILSRKTEKEAKDLRGF